MINGKLSPRKLIEQGQGRSMSVGNNPRQSLSVCFPLKTSTPRIVELRGSALGKVKYLQGIQGEFFTFCQPCRMLEPLHSGTPAFQDASVYFSSLLVSSCSEKFQTMDLRESSRHKSLRAFQQKKSRKHFKPGTTPIQASISTDSSSRGMLLQIP